MVPEKTRSFLPIMVPAHLLPEGAFERTMPPALAPVADPRTERRLPAFPGALVLYSIGLVPKQTLVVNTSPCPPPCRCR